MYSLAHSQSQSKGMLSAPLFSSYSLRKSSYFTFPVRSTSNSRKAISYSASGLRRRFSKAPQSARLSLFEPLRSATWNRMLYCSRLILC